MWEILYETNLTFAIICVRSCKDFVTDSTTAATSHNGGGQRRAVETTCCDTTQFATVITCWVSFKVKS